MNDVPAIILNVQRQPGANIIQVVDRITNLLPQLKTSLPSSSRRRSSPIALRRSGRPSTTCSSPHAHHRVVVMVIFLFFAQSAATVIPASRPAVAVGRSRRCTCSFTASTT